MKILMLSGDPDTINAGTEAYERMQQYAAALGELKILALSGRNVLRRFFNLWSLWRRATELMRETRYDVIIVQAADDVGLAGYFLSRRFGAPLQVQIHTDVFSPWYRRAGWKEQVRYWLARFLVPRADCIRVVSERIRKSILGKSDFPREVRLPKVTVLPIFTNISKFLEANPDPETEQRFKDSEFKMLAVGRFVDKEKNFGMLIDMMRDFVKICPKALLVLVGDGPDKSSYQLLVTSYRLEKNVIIELWRDDLSSFYKSFDLYLMSSNYEGWGRTVIEAMASGLPVVMTDVGLAGEVVREGENGSVVPVADRRSFYDAVLAIYKNMEKRTRFVEAGRRTVAALEPRSKREYLERYKESICQCTSWS